MRQAVSVALCLALAACGGASTSDDDDDDIADGGGGDDDDDDDDDDDNQFCGDLTAIIRDFSDEHPDFEEDNMGGAEHVAGLVEDTLGPDGTPVYAPEGAVPPHTTNAENFADWYHDVDGTNQRIEISIPLSNVGNGVQGFDSDSFFPIDGEGFGDEGREHNFHFTTEVHTSFEYVAGDVFTFRGDDDLWLFVNGRLALDIGGLHDALEGSVDLDAQAADLGIEPGQTYPMDIFHAERHTEESNFRIDTTIDCFIIE